jgi:hypothetical protein
VVKSPIEDGCQQEAPSDDVVLGTIARWMTTDLAWEAWPPFRVRGMDEMALKKGPRDDGVLVTARRATGRRIVLAGLPDRTKAPLGTWVTPIPAPLRRQLRTVGPARWDASVAAGRAVLRHAALVIDRLQVAQHDRDGADTWRQPECTRVRAALPHETMDPLTHPMGPFRQRPADLEVAAQDRLTRLLEPAPQRKPAYARRDQRTTLFDTARSNAEGLRRLDRGRPAVEASGLPCFAPVLTLVDTWLDLMAHDCRQRQPSGVVAGLHNTLTGLKRRGVGIAHLRQLFQRLTLDLEGYRRVSPWQGAHHSIWAPPRQVLESREILGEDFGLDQNNSDGFMYHNQPPLGKPFWKTSIHETPLSRERLRTGHRQGRISAFTVFTPLLSQISAQHRCCSDQFT